MYTVGGKNSGKTFAVEGNVHEKGVLSLMVEDIFNTLSTKRTNIMEEVANNKSEQVSAATFNFTIRMKFLEIKDEKFVDLLQKFNHYRQPANLVPF